MPNSLGFKLLCGFLLGVAAIFGVIVGFGSAEFVRTALTPRPETFTELYFENHLELPKTILPEQPLAVTYTIHNLEHQPMVYPVHVYSYPESRPDQITTLQKAMVAVAHDQTQSVPVEFQLPDQPAAGQT